jgi:hypothetical protein
MILVAGCQCTTPSATEETEAAGPVRALVCWKRDKRLGALQFPQGGAPTLAIEAQGPDGDAFKAAWEKLFAKGKLSAKIHQDRDDERPLTDIEAAPGEPSYGFVVQLKMQDDYGYDCRDETPRR